MRYVIEVTQRYETGPAPDGTRLHIYRTFPRQPGDRQTRSVLCTTIEVVGGKAELVTEPTSECPARLTSERAQAERLSLIIEYPYIDAGDPSALITASAEPPIEWGLTTDDGEPVRIVVKPIPPNTTLPK
jgi:hypothetical protein